MDRFGQISVEYNVDVQKLLNILQLQSGVHGLLWSSIISSSQYGQSIFVVFFRTGE